MPEPITVAMVGVGGGGILWGLARRQFRIFKELMDIVGGAIALVIFLPVMVLCAAIIKISDPAGPVLYRQVRVGLNRRLFTIYKLRTMRVDAEKRSGAVWATENDPRVTGLGKFLRKYRIDELPQLWNVLLGDMNIVGPRPERPSIVARLREG